MPVLSGTLYWMTNAATTGPGQAIPTRPCYNSTAQHAAGTDAALRRRERSQFGSWFLLNCFPDLVEWCSAATCRSFGVENTGEAPPYVANRHHRRPRLREDHALACAAGSRLHDRWR